MPKIKTDLIKIGGTNYEVQIYYSDENRFYVKMGLPKEMGAYVQLSNVMLKSGSTKKDYNAPNYETIDDLRAAVKVLVADYEKVIKSRRKIIIIEIGIAKKTMEQIYHEEDKYGRRKEHRFETYGDYGFGFDYKVGYEYRTGDEFEYTHEYERNKFMKDGTEIVESKTGVGDRDIVIDWSEETEDFCKRLISSTQTLCESIIQFFDRDPKVVQQAIKHGDQLLLDRKQTP